MRLEVVVNLNGMMWTKPTIRPDGNSPVDQETLGRFPLLIAEQNQSAGTCCLSTSNFRIGDCR